MASTTPTPASLGRILRLCWLAAFAPERFSELEEQDNELLKKDTALPQNHGVRAVRQAFAGAALWGASSVAIGAIVAWTVSVFYTPGTNAIAVSASIGTAVLLWATLALAGWEIQTVGGVSLTERVNRWYFRGLYWIGTLLIVVAAVWGIG